MKMFQKALTTVRFKQFAYGVMALCLSACDVHQFPEQLDEAGGSPDPEDPDLLVDLDMKLVYFTDMYLWEHNYDPKLGTIVEAYPDAAVDESHPGTTDKFSGKLDFGFKNVTAKFYAPGSSTHQRLEESVSDVADGYDETRRVRLMPGEYDVVVWTDFTETEEHPRFYNSSDFNSVKIDYPNYAASTDFRDAHRGRTRFTLDGTGGEIEVEMKRPLAKYEFITTDLSEFLDNESRRLNRSSRATMDDYKVIIYYSTYHPSSYNAVDDWNSDSATGVSFETQVTVTGESEASLGFDYVFINDISTGAVEVTIVVNDLDGNRVAQSQQLHVPLRRDHHTLLRGAFLTMNGSGGVGIDPGYDGDHNVPLH